MRYERCGVDALGAAVNDVDARVGDALGPHRDKDQVTERLIRRLRDLGVVVEVKAT
jgi:hypothetical protein